MSPETTAANVLILGRTGTGKSALLNYLSGRQAAPVGSARPTTGRGIHQYPPLKINELTVNIFDSWGLESDRAETWRKIVTEEIERRDNGELEDWFHTILYCFDAQKGRLEPFELNGVIEPLLDSGNRLILVLTKADLADKASLDTLTAILAERFPEAPQVQIASAAKTLRTGKVVEPFGRETLIEAIAYNLWANVSGRIPRVFLNRATAGLRDWRAEMLSLYDQRTGWFGLLRNYRKILDEINDQARIGLIALLDRQTLWLERTIDRGLDFAVASIRQLRGDRRPLSGLTDIKIRDDQWSGLLKMDRGDALASFLAVWPVVPVATAILGPVLKRSYRRRLAEELERKNSELLAILEERATDLDRVLDGGSRLLSV